MENLEISREGDIITIKLDARKRLRKSSTGKNMLVAMTGGNVPLPGDDGLFLGLNVYTRVQ